MALQLPHNGCGTSPGVEMLKSALFAALSVFLLLTSGPVQAKSPRTLSFTGSLRDEKSAPMGGVYWMKFALHRSETDTKEIWSEEQYVAVEKGRYDLELGKQRPVPRVPSMTSLFISIQLDGVEVQRLPVTDEMLTPADQPATAGTPGSSTCKKCVQAETAKDCQRLGGMTVKQLVNTAVKKEIEVGGTAHFTSAVGGGEGTPFRLTCPPGFVATGIKGKAGETITSLQLVCSPLEGK